MKKELLHTKWKTQLTMTLSEVFQENDSFDVTLVSDEQIAFQAHKVVLSACSPVLKTLLLNNPHAHPLIYLRGVKQQELNSILQFMYLGEATIFQDDFYHILETLKDLEMKELTLFIKREMEYRNNKFDAKFSVDDKMSLDGEIPQLKHK